MTTSQSLRLAAALVVLLGSARKARAAADAAPAARIAVGAGMSVGDGGFGTELGGMTELQGRYQLFPWLGVGASYFQLGAGNNEYYPVFRARGVGLHAAWHPCGARRFDPFLRLGPVAFVDVAGTERDRSTTSRLGLEGMAGVNVAFRHVALGAHAQYGFTNQAWTMMGLHVEARF